MIFRTIQPPIEADTEWSSVRSKIEKESSFKVREGEREEGREGRMIVIEAIGSEEERETLFKEFAKGTGEESSHHKDGKKKKKEKKKKDRVRIDFLI